MARLKGGQILIDLYSLGNVNDLNNDESTETLEWDLSNILEKGRTLIEWSKILSKNFVFGVNVNDELVTIKPNNVIGSMGDFDALVFDFTIEQKNFRIEITMGDSYGNINVKNPTIKITKLGE